MRLPPLLPLVAALALCAALLAVVTAPADAAVMGIDFGSEFIKVSTHNQTKAATATGLRSAQRRVSRSQPHADSQC